MATQELLTVREAAETLRYAPTPGEVAYGKEIKVRFEDRRRRRYPRAG